MSNSKTPVCSERSQRRTSGKQEKRHFDFDPSEWPRPWIIGLADNLEAEAARLRKLEQRRGEQSASNAVSLAEADRSIELESWERVVKAANQLCPGGRLASRLWAIRCTPLPELTMILGHAARLAWDMHWARSRDGESEPAEEESTPGCGEALHHLAELVLKLTGSAELADLLRRFQGADDESVIYALQTAACVRAMVSVAHGRAYHAACEHSVWRELQAAEEDGVADLGPARRRDGRQVAR